jgi:sortase A
MAEADKLSGTLQITGKIGDAPWKISLPVANAAAGQGLSKLWARRKLDDFEVKSILGQMETEAANKAMLQVALAHQIVSSQTSLIAVDKTPKRPPGQLLTRAEVPLNLPAGWSFEKVFGTDKPVLERDAKLQGFTQVAVLDQPQQLNAAAQVQLPQTATPSQLLKLLGFLLLAIGILLQLISSSEVGVNTKIISTLCIIGGTLMLGKASWITMKAEVAQVLLDRAFTQSLATGQPVKAWNWADTWPVAELRLPRLNARAIVLSGASGEALAFGPAWLAETAKPGERGTSVIAAHRDTHFDFLQHAKIGDAITLTGTNGLTYTYRITQTRIADATNSGITRHAPGFNLVLSTCWPFNALTQGKERYIVEAVLD